MQADVYFFTSHQCFQKLRPVRFAVLFIGYFVLFYCASKQEQTGFTAVFGGYGTVIASLFFYSFPLKAQSINILHFKQQIQV